MKLDLRRRLVEWYGENLVSKAEGFGVTVHVLEPGATFADSSSVLSRYNVDKWPTPPAGVYVDDERAAYLRRTDDMVLAHEFAHALDHTLGGTEYLSSTSREIRRAFADVTAFVTPYAASACNEYFAECMRAYVGANTYSSRPPVSRMHLESVDPAMYGIITRIFAEYT